MVVNLFFPKVSTLSIILRVTLFLETHILMFLYGKNKHSSVQITSKWCNQNYFIRPRFCFSLRNDPLTCGYRATTWKSWCGPPLFLSTPSRYLCATSRLHLPANQDQQPWMRHSKRVERAPSLTQTSSCNWAVDAGPHTEGGDIQQTTGVCGKYFIYWRGLYCRTKTKAVRNTFSPASSQILYHLHQSSCQIWTTWHHKTQDWEGWQEKTRRKTRTSWSVFRGKWGRWTWVEAEGLACSKAPVLLLCCSFRPKPLTAHFVLLQHLKEPLLSLQANTVGLQCVFVVYSLDSFLTSNLNSYSHKTTMLSFWFKWMQKEE